ncbi:MAG: anthranilate phosphoribosyltransferase [Nitrospinae bacterium]|nr:anthranilate phosphoribosyltransferase [Nitrospinota bacterium]
MIKEAIDKVVKGIDLPEGEMITTMNEIMEGEATPAQIGSFITALRMKGETVDEITGAVRVMREKAVRIKTRANVIVDTCGTGGDGAQTFNISTIAAFVVAGTGLTVAKHGNRSISSKSGSADLLERLGINIEVDIERVERCLDEIGIGFLFAPILHSAMRYAIAPRREIGIRTIFNILGPLTNPAGATSQVIGVYDRKLVESLADVLQNLGSRHVFVVHGNDGLDEFTLTDKTMVAELRDGRIKCYEISPEDVGLNRCRIEDLRVNDPEENVRITEEILEGKGGAKRDIVLLNASAAIVAGGKADTLKE